MRQPSGTRIEGYEAFDSQTPGPGAKESICEVHPIAIAPVEQRLFEGALVLHCDVGSFEQHRKDACDVFLRNSIPTTQHRFGF